MKRWSSFLLVPALLLLPACDDDSTDPDEVGLDAFIGSYALDPSPQMTCDLGDFGEATVRIDTIDVTDASEDSLFLRVPLAITTSAFGDHDAETSFSVAVTGDDGFAGDSPIEVTVPVGLTDVHGEGELSIDGEFTSEDTFEATTDGNFSVAIGDGTPVPCEIEAQSITGTRAD